MRKKTIWLSVAILVVGMLVMTSVYSVKWLFYSANILNFESGRGGTMFSGLVYPIERVPNWVNVDQSRWDGNFDDFNDEELMGLPVYDADLLAMSAADLGWDKEEDLRIRNLKLSYLVPYMGNYKLDGQEFAGSHLAVDIRAPKGTPVRVIGAGAVEKVSYDEYGFGQHVVVKHEGFPSFDGAANKTTYYSSYSHLSGSVVTEGQVLKKGEIIGESGSTGSSSLPHLHFQIDESDAPWHPFWPFTAKELRMEGIDFIEAINNGFNRERALQYTIHPMEYIHHYADFVPKFSDVNSESEQNEISELVKEEIIDGYEDGTFRPNNVVNRAEAVKMILALNKSDLGSGDVPFADVETDAWYAKYVGTAYSQGIVDGYDDGTFRPGNTVNKVEFIKMLLDSLGEEVAYGDGDLWFSPYIKTAASKGLINSEVDVAVGEDIRRIDAAKIIRRALQLKREA